METIEEQYKKIQEIDGFKLVNKNLTKEEQIEWFYRYKKLHARCEQAIYSKGKTNINKLYVGGHECTLSSNGHYWDDYYGLAGCDNCINLWKKEEELKGAENKADDLKK